MKEISRHNLSRSSLKVKNPAAKRASKRVKAVPYADELKGILLQSFLSRTGQSL